MPEEQKDQEFTFDPQLINSGNLDDKKEVEEPKVEKLDLFKDTIFDASKEKEIDKPDDIDKDKDIEDVDKDKDAPAPDDIKDKDDPSSKAVFSVVLGQDLMDRGVLSSFDAEEIAKISKEKGEAEAVSAIMEAQAKATSEELKNSYDSNYQDYLALLQGGVSKQEATGLQQLESFQKSLEGVDLKTEDDTSVAARKDLLTVNYRLNTNFSEEKIQKMVQKSYDEGTDLEEIEEATSGLKDYISKERTNVVEAGKQRELQATQSREKLETDYKSFINSTEEYFKGETVTKKTKDSIEKILFTPVKTANGTTNELWAKRDQNPIKFDSKMAYLHSIGYFDDKPLDKFVKNATTKATSNLEGFLNDNKGRDFMKSSNKSFNKDTSSKADFLDF